MTNIRARYEVIDSLKLSENSSFAELETAAFHFRKSIEGVAFGCLVALENGIKKVPRDAKGQWNADRIFAKLTKREEIVFPKAFLREDPPEGSNPEIDHHMAEVPQVNLSVDDVRNMYRRSHKWLHEWNPYVESLRDNYDKSKAELLEDIPKIWNWLVAHWIGINGEVFLGLLKEAPDNQVRIVAATAKSSKVQ